MKLVAVGCSWGGLSALSLVLRELPTELDAAVVVAQHRSQEASALELLLRDRSRLPLHEADDKDELEPGHAYLAPAGYHLLVERDSRDAPGDPARRSWTGSVEPTPGRLALSTDAPVRFARPSLDVLFESAADAYGRDCVGVVLTGANDDGAAGLARIVEEGGAAIVQDPETAERPEMPRAAIEAVPAALALPLERIPVAIVGVCGTRAAREEVGS